jgi:hypothetical protein
MILIELLIVGSGIRRFLSGGQKRGYKIKEIPVKWNESNSTKVNIIKDAEGMGRQIARLWWDLGEMAADMTGDV